MSWPSISPEVSKKSLQFAGLIVLAILAFLYVASPFDKAAPSGAAAKTEAPTAGENEELAATGRRPGMRPDVSRRLPAAPLPPTDTPLKDMFAELQARSSAGDVHAAVRLYREVNRCILLRGVDWNYGVDANAAMNAKTEGMGTEELQNYQAELDRISEGQQMMQKVRDVCAGATSSMFRSMVPTIRQAALLGDSDARACYLSRGPTIDPRAFVDQPELIEDYRRSAQSLIDSGLAAGDWKVVDILRDAYRAGSQSMVAGLVGSDPAQYYKYLKLYRLGPDPYRSDELDRELAAVKELLTPAQLDEADSWVSERLPNFAGHSAESTAPGWDPCTFPYE